MLKFYILTVFISLAFLANAQSFSEIDIEPKQDSIKKNRLLISLGNGYFPTKYFNLDLRYLIKFNQYEGVRTGLGGITNENFSKRFRINGYAVYGFRDHRFKYSIGGGFKISEPTHTWINISYTDDLQETGSTTFLTDGRFFQFFEPRLLNISLFHKHITKTISLEHQLHPKLLNVTAFAISNINPTYNYGYHYKNTILNHFHLSTFKTAVQWSPFSKFKGTQQGMEEIKSGYPKFTIQYTKNLSNVFRSNLSFSKVDFKAIHKIGNEKAAFSEFTLVSGMAKGDAPITYLYHAYPNNINKETILQRFSVAGLTSFETMYFNEFFSDRFATLQLKHYLKPFAVSTRYKPQMVLITRYAIGDMEHPEKHENMTFGLLNKGYTESGFEINKLLFGFGISFTYRYGAYHLPVFEDNIAFKFTFNVTL